MNDLLTAPGAAIKALNHHTVGGYAIMFTSPYDVDREGDWFSRDTGLDLDDRSSVTGYWHHLLDPSVPEPLGKATFEINDEGVFATLKLRNDDVGQRIFKLAEADRLSWSSGSASHLVRKEKVGNSNWIRRWPVVEFSVLGREDAAMPQAKVTALKSLSDALVVPLSHQQQLEQRAMQAYADSLMLGLKLQMLRLNL